MVTQKDINSIYTLIFNRASTYNTLNYWTTQGDSLEEICDAMLHSDDGESILNLSNKEFVEKIYMESLHKTYADDPDGIDYWIALLEDGVSKSKLLTSLYAAIQTYAPGGINYQIEDTQTTAAYDYFSNRTEVSWYASTLLENSPADEDTKLSFDSYFLHVNNTPESLEYSKKVIDSIAQNSLTLSHTSLATFEQTPALEALNSTQFWEDKTITYGFNTSLPTAYTNYDNTQGTTVLTNNWQPLNPAQQEAIVQITESVEQFADISLIQSSAPQVAFNIVDMEPNVCGFAFYPGIGVVSGDVFLSSRINVSEECALTKGSQGYEAAVHELGHALGLKHPFEGAYTLAEDQNDVNHTVMSYTNNNYVPVFTEESRSVSYTAAPIWLENFSLYDIETLQAVYGANFSTNTQDDTYTLTYTDFNIDTVWDAGGTDTLDFSLSDGNTYFDMHGGTLNSVDQYSLSQLIELYQKEVLRQQSKDFVSETITALYNDNTLYTGKNNFAIVKGTVIENISTGSGDDTIIDNEVDNIIQTGNGDDSITVGNGGLDYIDGGDGWDTLFVNISKPQNFTLLKEGSKYFFNEDGFGAVLTGIEQIEFRDDTLFLEGL